jgi:hypothetical protein
VFIAQNFARDRTFILGSLKFIANNHGESLLGYEDSTALCDRISSSVELDQVDYRSESIPCSFGRSLYM